MDILSEDISPQFLERMKREFDRQKAQKSLAGTAQRLEEIKANPPQRTGIASGRYPEIRAVLKTQRASGGVRKDPKLPYQSGIYNPESRQIRISPETPQPMVRGLRRHEGFHDIQNVGKKLGQTITSPLERLSWGKGGLGQVASEFQAYAAQYGGPWKAAQAMTVYSPHYAEDPIYAKSRPVFKTLATVNKANEAGRNLLPAARQLGAALGTEAASVGGMALRGAGRLAGPVGMAMTAYDLAQAFPAPAPISEEDMGKALRSYRTGPQPAY